MRGPAVPPKVEDATSYEQMWAGFARGCTVPDPFRRLFQAIGLAFTPYDAHITMCGYGLTRRITIQLANVFNQDAINTFLITLATFDRSLQLTTGWDNLWSILLTCKSNCLSTIGTNSVPSRISTPTRGKTSDLASPHPPTPPSHGRSTPAGGEMTSCKFSLL